MEKIDIIMSEEKKQKPKEYQRKNRQAKNISNG